MSYHLFLDDSRQPHAVDWINLPDVSWVICKTYYDFVKQINEHGIPAFVTYDCDLHDEHYQAYFDLKQDYVKHFKKFKNRCGIDCADFLLAECMKKGVKHPPFLVHSKNQFGGAFITNMINQYNDPKSVPTDISKLTVSKIPAYCIHDERAISGFFGDYRFLSNFWPARVEYRGLWFPSTECAYQAAKCADPDNMKQFVFVGSSEAKKLGNKIELRSDWTEANRIAIMRYLVMQKFSMHDDLRERLMATGTRHLVEANNWKDKFWGIHFENGFTYGQNHLGSILMEVRNVLK